LPLGDAVHSRTKKQLNFANWSRNYEMPPRTRVLTLVLIPWGIKGQVIRLGSDSKRTIEITTTGKISVVADSAVVKLGFAHVAESKNAAYSESVRMGNKIVRTLLDAGMSTEYIQTESLNVGQEESRRNGGVAAKPQELRSRDSEFSS